MTNPGESGGGTTASKDRNRVTAGAARRQRKSRRSLDAEKRAEIGAARGDVPKFDPEEICEEMALHWLNGSDRYFLRGPKGDWLEIGGPQLKVKLMALGWWSTPMSPKDEPGLAPIHYQVSQVDQVMLWARERRGVDHAMNVAGYRDGYHLMGQTRVLVRRGPDIIEPREGDFSTLSALITGVLCGVEEKRGDVDDGVVGESVFRDQLPYFCGWLRVAYEAVREGRPRPGQALILAGPAGCGKGRLQHFIISPIVGGRAADPSGYMFGRTDFNAELFGSEHLMMEDPATSDKRDDRMYFGEMIKQFAVNDAHRFHPKGRDAVTLTPFWRLSISLNDDPDKITVLPPLTPDILDKLILLRCFKNPMPMPTGTLKERVAFEAQIRSELPAFLHHILSTDAYLVGADRDRARFGCTAWQNPSLSEMLFDQSPAARLLQLLDQTKPWTLENGGDGEAWVGSAQDLEAWLCNPETPGVGQSRAFQARKVIKRVELPRLLARLEQDVPQRFGRKRRAHQRVWIVMSPAADADIAAVRGDGRDDA